MAVQTQPHATARQSVRIGDLQPAAGDDGQVKLRAQRLEILDRLQAEEKQRIDARLGVSPAARNGIVQPVHASGRGAADDDGAGV